MAEQLEDQVLVQRQRAAQLLDMSLSHFKRHVQPHVPCTYVGQLRMYRPEDLRRWRDAQTCDPAGVA
jgi:hypothetical protein